MENKIIDPLKYGSLKRLVRNQTFKYNCNHGFFYCLLVPEAKGGIGPVRPPFLRLFQYLVFPGSFAVFLQCLDDPKICGGETVHHTQPSHGHIVHRPFPYTPDGRKFFLKILKGLTGI